MNWTKATDAPPPKGQLTLITVRYSDGSKEVICDAKHDGEWKHLYGGSWKPIASGEVTHWMPMPAPAED